MTVKLVSLALFFTLVCVGAQQLTNWQSYSCASCVVSSGSSSYWCGKTTGGAKCCASGATSSGCTASGTNLCTNTKYKAWSGLARLFGCSSANSTFCGTSGTVSGLNPWMLNSKGDKTMVKASVPTSNTWPAFCNYKFSNTAATNDNIKVTITKNTASVWAATSGSLKDTKFSTTKTFATGKTGSFSWKQAMNKPKMTIWMGALISPGMSFEFQYKSDGWSTASTVILVVILIVAIIVVVICVICCIKKGKCKKFAAAAKGAAKTVPANMPPKEMPEEEESDKKKKKEKKKSSDSSDKKKKKHKKHSGSGSDSSRKHHGKKGKKGKHGKHGSSS